MAADAGITKNVSFHTSRHTTQVYADVVMETKVEAIRRISNYFLTCTIRVEKCEIFSTRIFIITLLYMKLYVDYFLR